MTGPHTPGTAEKPLGEIVTDVTDKATLLIREEIELAKTEISEKVTSMAKGAAAAAAAGVFAVFALIYLLHALAWFFVDLFDWSSVWPGYLIVFGILILLTGIVGFIGIRWLKKGSPPTPQMAIDEAKLTREALGDGRP